MPRRKESSGVKDTGHVLINGVKVTMKELTTEVNRGIRHFWTVRGYVLDEHGNPRRPDQINKTPKETEKCPKKKKTRKSSKR